MENKINAYACVIKDLCINQSRGPDSLMPIIFQAQQLLFNLFLEGVKKKNIDKVFTPHEKCAHAFIVAAVIRTLKMAKVFHSHVCGDSDGDA